MKEHVVSFDGKDDDCNFNVAVGTERVLKDCLLVIGEVLVYLYEADQEKQV